VTTGFADKTVTRAVGSARARPFVLSAAGDRRRRFVRAGFDSAQTNDANRRHWAQADGYSPDAALSPEVRRILRNRARYEVANNSYARGIVSTLANDTVGTGPRLQMLSASADFNRMVETEFHSWAQAVGLPEKLRTMRMARTQDGEAFAILGQNGVVDHPVQLDLLLLEADQVTGPFGAATDSRDVDGVILDRAGNPTSYRVLWEHPGGAGSLARYADFAYVPAASMIHAFRQDRPGQHRGLPEITAALPLFAQLRRFTLAVLAAAESAADFAGILYTDAPANGEATDLEPLDPVELRRNMLLTMPGGWRMAQLEPAQPATTYGEFKQQILNEIARCLNMPFNVAAGNSSGYNYASGRLDHQVYFKSIKIDQAYQARRILDRVLSAWLPEFMLATGNLLPGAFDRVPKHQWFWDGNDHVDPLKEANAQAVRLANHTTTLAHEYARQGKDWEVEIRQRAREIALLRELGLTAAQAQPTPQKETPPSEEEE
jgi:lambda family phage portal protein